MRDGERRDVSIDLANGSDAKNNNNNNVLCVFLPIHQTFVRHTSFSFSLFC